LRITPTASVEMACSVGDDHVLPRLQWGTTRPVREARVAWLLVPERVDAPAVLPSVELKQDAVMVTEGEKRWRLPVVRRRVPWKSSMTLIRDADAEDVRA